MADPALTHQVAVIGAAYAALYAAHGLGDHWFQPGWVSSMKGDPGLVGRVVCAFHVFVYIIVQGLALGLLPVSPAGMAAGLTVSAVTHYIADRRAPLRAMARRAGKADYIALATVVRRPGDGTDDTGPGTGLFHLDQSWHHAWNFVAAWLIGVLS